MTRETTEGNVDSLDETLSLVYDELRRLAAHYLRGERPNHTLQPTALVNEAYLCLANQQNVQWENQAHFMAIAARTMRHVLVDYARERGALKRGGELQRVTLHSRIRIDDRDVEIVALDEALTRLSAFAPDACRVVELRYFGGLTIEETAEVLKSSPATVKRHWTVARAWLHRELQSS
jgi:RNA polymerase sigma-70 factor (ECF subfamily)